MSTTPAATPASETPPLDSSRPPCQPRRASPYTCSAIAAANPREDRHTAEPRYGHGVHLAPARLVDEAATPSEGAHDRRDQERHRAPPRA